MGIFATSSPFDQCVERATNEKNTGEDWALIMDVCDKVKDSSSGPKDCLKSISKRLNHDNPRVVLQTVTLLDACVNNCGRKFLLEVAGREFEQELSKLLTSSKTHLKVASRLRDCLKGWVEGEFKGDPEMGLIPALYNKLLREGYDFDQESDVPKKTVVYSTDPNVVNSKQEEDDIAKAIQLSLQGGSSSKQIEQGHTLSPTSLYGEASAVLSSTEHPVPGKEPLKVRAIYDFEAAEDNELTFKAGEIILVVDHSDPNWWKGTNHRGEGLFPANFVSKSLEDSEQPKSELAGKKVSFSESVEVTEVDQDLSLELHRETSGEINEDRIDQLIHLLHEADPTGERPDDHALPMLEDHVNAMAPNIDAELERIDRKHAQLAISSKDLVGALNMYHQLMREMPPTMPYYAPFHQGVSNPPAGLPMHSDMVPNQFLPPNLPHSTGYPQYPSNIVGGPMPQYMPSPSIVSASPGGTSSYQPPSSMSGNSLPGYSLYPPHGQVPAEFVALTNDPRVNAAIHHAPNAAMKYSMMPTEASHMPPPSVASDPGHPVPINSVMNVPRQVPHSIPGQTQPMPGQVTQSMSEPIPQPMPLMSQEQSMNPPPSQIFYTQPNFQSVHQPLL